MDLITDGAKSLHKALLGATLKESIQIIAAEIFVIDAGFQHFVYGLQDTVRDGECGALFAGSPCDLPEACTQVGILRLGRSECCLHKRCREVNIASTLLLRHALAA